MNYEWIKEGAKYRVVANHSHHQFRISDVVWWTGEKDIFTNGHEGWHLWEEEVELVKNDTLTVGGTYTSKNGTEWLCIAVDGEYAHMRLPENPASAAYCFKTDGTNISQGGGDWDIKFEPVREAVVFRGGLGAFTMTIDMVDGKPDWSSAKLTGA